MIFQAYLGCLVEMTNIFGIVFRITYQCLAILGIYELSSQRFSQLFDGNPKELATRVLLLERKPGSSTGEVGRKICVAKTKKKQTSPVDMIRFSCLSLTKFWLPTTASRTLGHCVLRCMTPRSRRWSIHTLKGEKASCESASRRGCGND